MAGSFFFLIQKERATMPGSKTFSPFITADIRTSFVSANVLKKWRACRHAPKKEEEGKRCKGWWSNSGCRRHVEVRLPKESNVER